MKLYDLQLMFWSADDIVLLVVSIISIIFAVFNALSF